MFYTLYLRSTADDRLEKHRKAFIFLTTNKLTGVAICVRNKLSMAIFDECEYNEYAEMQ